MSESITKGKTETKVRTARPRLFRVVLLNDDYTPREFVVLVLKAVFRLSEDEAEVRMITAHQKGVSVVGLYQRNRRGQGHRSRRSGARCGVSADVRHRARGIVSILPG
jgi:ATP-dependent Clp protease adaptor protein ClpS